MGTKLDQQKAHGTQRINVIKEVSFFQDTYDKEFLCASEKGIFVLTMNKDKLFRKVADGNEILKGRDVKHILTAHDIPNFDVEPKKTQSLDFNIYTPPVKKCKNKYHSAGFNKMWLIFPKWEKKVYKYTKHNNSLVASKTMEWTNSLTRLNLGKSEEFNEDWRVGIAGSSMYLTEIVSEKSYQILKNTEFNTENYVLA